MFFDFLKRIFGCGKSAKPQKDMLSPAAEKLLIDYEVGGGKAYYNRFLRRPTWPGAYSGVTVGIGYDLGHHTKGQIRRDWGEHVSEFVLEKMLSVAGIKGHDARRALPSVQNEFEVPWPAALAVFREVTIPRFVKLTKKAFPGSEKLDENAFGALVSLVFNRGTSMKGSRRREMAAIRSLVPHKDYAGIAREIESMVRLWDPNRLRGLHRRRHAEANLVRSCA